MLAFEEGDLENFSGQPGAQICGQLMKCDHPQATSCDGSSKQGPPQAIAGDVFEVENVIGVSKLPDIALKYCIVDDNDNQASEIMRFTVVQRGEEEAPETVQGTVEEVLETNEQNKFEDPRPVMRIRAENLMSLCGTRVGRWGTKEDNIGDVMTR